MPSSPSQTKQDVETALSPLLGLRMWKATRAADMECFQFGVRHTTKTFFGEPCEVGDYALHVQCAWRIAGPDGIIVASRDIFVPAGNPEREPDGFDYMKFGANLRDERRDELFHRQPENILLVTGIEADEYGSVRLSLTGGFILQVFPDDSLA